MLSAFFPTGLPNDEFGKCTSNYMEKMIFISLFLIYKKKLQPADTTCPTTVLIPVFQPEEIPTFNPYNFLNFKTNLLWLLAHRSPREQTILFP